ncbi:MAG: phosphoribosyltransferase, partial [Polyangiaceae bacterium]|nr:phosphoribosyltransferase [Polyangiaceae bacterium]
MERLANREKAGAILAKALRDYRGRDDVLVLALPRGGVPVGYVIAKELGAELDVMVVRKLGFPGQPELAMGAIASGGTTVLNPSIAAVVPSSEIEAVAVRELAELERREKAYRGGRPPAEIAGRCIILVDDGLATGATMRAAIAAVRPAQPKEVVVAVPVAPPSTVATLSREADRVVCPNQPTPFLAIGPWYQDFRQVSDREVVSLLE